MDEKKKQLLAKYCYLYKSLKYSYSLPGKMVPLFFDHATPTVRAVLDEGSPTIMNTILYAGHVA